MSMSDPLGDMLTRIRNGQHAKMSVITCPASKQRARVLEVLKAEGFIRGYRKQTDTRGLAELAIELKYNDGEPAIKEIHRISKPGRRIYEKVRAMGRFYNGLGVRIISTPKGVLSDAKAREENVGGEVLCEVF